MSFSRILFIVAAAALLGFGLFAILAYRATTVTTATSEQARAEYQAVLDRWERPPVLVGDSFGHPHANLSLPDLPVPEPTELRVMAYRPQSRTLGRVDIPYWFFRMKGPFVNIALRHTEYDLGELGLDPDQLAEYGPGVVIDYQPRNGERILVWTE